MPPRHLILPLGEAARNLATEEILFRTLPAGHPGLFLLWRNEPAVIIGRHQCAAEEVDLARARAESLPVLRRITGGGAVCHDAGTLCFSWILNDAQGGLGPAFGRLLAPVVAALGDVGVAARLTGRNDLEAGGGKISGSAQTRAGGRLLVHGTLLVRADLARLGRVLTPAPQKQRTHGVASVGARVRNVAELWAPGNTPEGLMAALLARCAPEAEPPAGATEAMAALLTERKYHAPEWNLDGLSPATRVRRERFPWGMVELRLELAAGRVAGARVTGDFFSDHGPEALERRLEGCPAEEGAVRAALEGLPWGRLFLGCEAAPMRDFFAAAAGERP